MVERGYEKSGEARQQVQQQKDQQHSESHSEQHVGAALSTEDDGERPEARRLRREY